ncbi:MAG: DUF896 domain-containing protein [Epulopiscium sp.]|nr:DUF896 domain-containing protein [Candidatus Epulonipiscium sp.]
MEKEKIQRINELYKKQKSVGLTLEEQKEQHQLRQEYIQLMRNNFQQTIKSVYIQDKDGNPQPLKRKIEH